MSNKTINDIDENSIRWEKFKSKKGEKYEVGYLKESNLSEEKKAEILTKSDFGIAVSWPVGDKTWKSPNPDTQNIAAITNYTLCQQDKGEYYQYILWFINTEHYNYYFYDETGDYYQVNTFRNGQHYVRYNSLKPNIAYISGS